MAGTIFGRPMPTAEVCGRVDQAYVRKGLWKVAQQPPCFGIVLFREQTYIVAQVKQPLKELTGLTRSALNRQVIGKPEGANQKGAFARWKPINVGMRGVTVDKAISH